MKIYSKFPENSESSVFLHFTGSMFGMGCSAYNLEAIKRIDELKERTNKSGYIVLIPELNWLERFNVKVNVNLKHLLQQYWPGELTVILETLDPKLKHVSYMNKVAFRIPKSEFLREALGDFDQPIISTSVNKSGIEPKNDLDEIISQYNDWFDFGVLPQKIYSVSNLPSTIIEITNDGIHLIREGSIPYSEIQSSYAKPQILFVCTGNTCRSPIAEFLLQRKVSDSKLNFRVSSAGFTAGGMPISEGSQKVLIQQGIDALSHLSTKLNEDVIRSSWLILTMTDQHKRELLDRFPASVPKVYTLTEFTGLQGDIPDPFGKDEKYYKKVFDEINRSIQIIFDKIKEER